MKIVMMGTPEFAVPTLRAMVENGYEIVGVFTQPDRPSGRGKKLTPSPVKRLALEYGLPVFQPEKIRRDGVESLRSLLPDLCVTAAFGQILSQEILDIPPLGNINVHASLLPRHRGSAPIAHAIWQGDAAAGVTTMMMDRGIDTGDMLLRAETPIGETETCGELTERLSLLGADLLIRTLKELEAGTLRRVPQNEAEMTYDPMLTREMGRINFAEPAATVKNRILALNPWPCVSAEVNGERIRLLRARAEEGSGAPGEVLSASAGEGLRIACGQGVVRILELQAPGGKQMKAEDYLRGHRIPVGIRLQEEHA